MTKREFLGKEFYGWVQREVDSARHYLKNCGKPKGEVEVVLIRHHKETVKALARLL